MSEKSFKTIIPVELEKSSIDGNWKIRGLASTQSRDLQGEIIIQEGIDLTPINQKKGVFNFDHKPGIENIVGFIDSARKTDRGLVVEGRLLKNSDKAKAIYNIMSSLSESDRGRIGMSVEGVIKERTGDNNKIIKNAVINAVALTLSPVNTDTYVDLVKAIGCNELEFMETYNLSLSDELKENLAKALAVGGEYASSTPGNLSGGSALAQEGMDRKRCKKCMKSASVCKCMKKAKKRTRMVKSAMASILGSIQNLYPDYSRDQLWELFKERLTSKFPELKI